MQSIKRENSLWLTEWGDIMSIELAPTISGAPVRRWKTYFAYKDSGVEWLGEVPEEWEVKRLKYISTVNDETLSETTDLDYELLYVDISSVDPVSGIKYKEPMTFENAPSRARRKVRHGDVIISTVRTYLRAISPINFPEPNMIVSTGFAVIHPKESMESQFATHVLHAPYFVERVVANSVGVSYPAINASELITFYIALPPSSEQRAIAAFLNNETGRIDTLIEKKKRQIEVLQEKRAALISHAVTKGLDPDVKMKDSGVEWLGEVPEDWKLKRIKQIASKIGSGKTPKGGSEVYSESGVTFLRSQNIHFDGLRLDDVVFIKESIDEEMFSTRVFSNDVLLNITGASLGRCSLVPDNFTPANVNQHVCIVRPIKKSIVPLFLYNVFASKVVQAQIFSWENGSSREGLTFPQIANLVIVAPDDLEKQHSIAAFLDRETERIDTHSTKVHESISKLREYRTALISAAVTGKIDVRSEET